MLSDNLLMVFFGWEGVGLASFALIGFWYQDKKKDFVGTPGHYAGGIQLWATPTHAGIKALLMTKAGDVMMLAGMFLIFSYAGTFGFTELLHDQSWATEMAKNNLLVPAAVLIFGGAIGKSAQFPLNEWLLEAMTGPTPVSALIHARNNGQSWSIPRCQNSTIVLCTCCPQRVTILRGCGLGWSNNGISTCDSSHC